VLLADPSWTARRLKSALAEQVGLDLHLEVVFQGVILKDGQTLLEQGLAPGPPASVQVVICNTVPFGEYEATVSIMDDTFPNHLNPLMTGVYKYTLAVSPDQGVKLTKTMLASGSDLFVASGREIFSAFTCVQCLPPGPVDPWAVVDAEDHFIEAEDLAMEAGDTEDGAPVLLLTDKSLRRKVALNDPAKWTGFDSQTRVPLRLNRGSVTMAAEAMDAVVTA
jgi:hypothetical protein